jgi:multidrug resistance efflux pump
VQRLQAELAAAQGGIFLRDGANDAPYSQQQSDRLLLRRQELEGHMLEESLRSSRLVEEITEERVRLDRLGHFDLLLPASHVVWSVAASPGSTVSEGQTVLDLAVCERRFVVVELSEREFEQVKARDLAYVRLIGSDDWRQGQVSQVRGSAARADDRLLAAHVPRPDPNSIVVEIRLPDDESQAEHNNFCNIGRLAEVRFQRAGLGLLDRMTKKLQSLADYLKHDAAADSIAGN